MKIVLSTKDQLFPNFGIEGNSFSLPLLDFQLTGFAYLFFLTEAS